MALHPIFKLRTKATEGIIELLDSVVLGTNGAHYKHLDTRVKIEQADNPLFLSMERHEKTIGNITFCKRDKFWYIRYFAFAQAIQSSGTSKSNSGKTGLLKRELGQFFEDAFSGEYGDAPDSFYAYIDPENEKSLWMSENFGFETISEIKTRTFSRAYPKSRLPIQKIESWDEVSSFVSENFKNQHYYFEDQVNNPPYYVWEDGKGEIIGFAKISNANWKINRFPGKLGGVLTKLIPFIPVLNRIISPQDHNFIVPEAVYVKDPLRLGDFMESILHEEKKNLIIWWVDSSDPMFLKSKDCTKWGILDRIIGDSKAYVVAKHNPNTKSNKNSKAVYTSGFDFI